MHCYDVVDQEVTCNGYESRRVYDVEYYYDEVLVTRKTTVIVQFNTNGGGGMEELEVPANQPMDEPTDAPERAGYSFAGWSKDEAVIDETTGEMAEGKSLFDFSSPLTGETTLVANWKKFYEVTFDAGTVLPEDRRPVAQLVVAGDVPVAPVDGLGRQILVEYENYTLAGYYYDTDYESRYEGQPIVADTTLYVKWNNAQEGQEGGDEGDGGVTYTILEGANQTHSIIDDEEKDLVVRASGELDKFERAEVDGIAVGEPDAAITAGSTVVTLKADYLNALSLGVHTLKIVYNDGEVATNFTIVNPMVEDNPVTADESGMFKTMFVISLIGLSLGWLRFKSLAKND